MVLIHLQSDVNGCDFSFTSCHVNSAEELTCTLKQDWQENKTESITQVVCTSADRDKMRENKINCNLTITL